MKKAIILTVLLILGLSQNLISQKIDDSYSDIDKYRKEDIKSEFNDRFKKDNDKKDFKRLREFKREKEDLLDAIKNELEEYSDKSKELKVYDSQINKLTKLIDSKKGNEKIKIKPEWIEDFSDTYLLRRIRQLNSYSKIEPIQENNTKTLDEIKEYISQFETSKQAAKEETDVHFKLDKNAKNVKQDIYDCISQIDSALAPEYKEQEFRTNISICFTILIGILLVIFFFIVYKKSDNNLSKQLLSGYGLQFITLFVLIIAVILFGILSILQGSELAAILAGISGYILGKGVAPAKA